MKYYKHKTTNEIYAYDSDGSQDGFIKEGLVAISDEEASSILASTQQAAFNSLTYAQKRAAEYPPITDYIDGVVKGDQAQIQQYIDECLVVKAKYPKGSNP